MRPYFFKFAAERNRSVGLSRAGVQLSSSWERCALFVCPGLFGGTHLNIFQLPREFNEVLEPENQGKGWVR